MRRLLFLPLSVACLAACGPEDPLPRGPIQAASGGTSPMSTGGVTTGGATTGGALPSGGPGTGGVPSTGGASWTGGAPLTGGAGTTGGVATGGTGGLLSTGGVLSTGGFGPTGGVPTGGVAPTGGAFPSGGSPTGGVNPTGGVSPTGGVPTGGVPVSPYDHGVAPTTVTTNDARAAYDAWKTAHLEDCGGGVYRVRWENAKLDATVSEGIGYGMLLTVSWGDQAAFDGLLNYYQMAADDVGLMDWLRYGCDAHWELTYSEYPDGAAADADLDVAMALIMANCRWGGGEYAAEATRIINTIRTYMFIEDGALRVLQPGDSPWFDELGLGCVNYSYFTPAYYRAFATHVPADAAFWNGAATDAYTLLARASHGTTGLVRNWGSADGNDASPDCSASYVRAASYGDDAARTPWRVGTDYIWWGTPAAKTWADRVTTWVKTVPISATVQWYNRDGSADTQAPTYADHTAINVGPFAVGAMSSDQATVDQFAAALLAIPAGPGSHDGEYFPRMLRALSLLALSGGFTTCGGL